VDDVGTARVETFSDGVFAIAATLLILEIGVATPLHHSLGHELLHLWPSYLAYVTSFLTIAILWVNHHEVFSLIGRADRTLLFVNSLFLLVVAFIPFPTRLVAEFLNKTGERDAVLAYSITLALMAVLYNLLWRYASSNRRLIAEAVPQAHVDAITRAFRPGWILYLGIVALVFASPIAAVAMTLALAAFYVPSSALWVRKDGSAGM
jgi:uncharacterized membrane protein